MGTLTVAKIISQVQSDLNETTTTILSTEELTTIINDGYIDTCTKGLGYENLIEKTTVLAEKIIDLGNTAIKVNYVERHLIAGTGHVGIIAAFPQTVGHVPCTTGIPQYWFQWGQYLILEPIPTASTYHIDVYASCYPSTILSTGGTDLSASVLPVEFHECVYLFTLAYAALKLKRWSDAATAYNRYIEDVQRKRQEYVMKIPDTRLLHDIPDAVTIEEPKRG